MKKRLDDQVEAKLKAASDLNDEVKWLPLMGPTELEKLAVRVSTAASGLVSAAALLRRMGRHKKKGVPPGADHIKQ
ncbi:hypothetical protein L2Y96_18090 [Luteibacter aegosomaticola]|uniref:hypothetical protein n=1 Tax=Luteibacter aegosomaticola TaxID=2911538 RepID=UPI001FF82A83|nr:hypothetical protein [Luteibacter aegosomaticola]UPG89289.1 hypothetical protein L2Y96_18090 [Luteibacter aegosomaticola]